MSEQPAAMGLPRSRFLDRVSSSSPLMWLAVGATLLIAFVLRVWGIDFGLPYEGITHNQISFEESKEVQRAFKLGAGEYSWTFGKGGLYYILFVEYGVLFVVSWLAGWVNDTREFALQVLEDRTTVFMLGRITVALMGTMTCFVVFQLCRRLYDRRVGIAAALIGATAYYHAISSAVINVDVGMTLGVWSTLLVYVYFEQSRNTKTLVGVGVLAAVSIAFKAPGAIVIPIVGLAMLTAPGRLRDFRTLIKEGAIFVASALVALTVIAPEWVTGIVALLGNYTTDIATVSAEQMTDGAQLFAALQSVTIVREGTSWEYGRHLLNGHNLMLTLFALLGLVIGIYQRNRWDMIWAAFIVLFLVVMSLSDRTQPERYLMPAVPAFWMLAGRAVVAGGCPLSAVVRGCVRLHCSCLPSRAGPCQL